MDSINLTDRIFGELTVVSLHEKNHRGMTWLCACNCGNRVTLPTSHLLGTKTRNPHKSCGCVQKKQSGKTMEYSRLYSLWKEMIKRCYNDERENYERFGGKGIAICDEWRYDFNSFLDWALKTGYDPTLYLGRIDVSKQYEPSNCQWEGLFTQAQKRGLGRNNTTGHTGVSYSQKHGYRAYITRFKKRYNLGRFSTLSDAVKARKEAEEKYSVTEMDVRI